MENRETMARQCQGLRLEQSRLRAAVEARYADGRKSGGDGMAAFWACHWGL